LADLTLDEYRGFSKEEIKTILSKEKGRFFFGDSAEIRIPVKKIGLLERITLKLQVLKFVSRWKIILSGTR